MTLDPKIIHQSTVLSIMHFHKWMAFINIAYFEIATIHLLKTILKNNLFQKCMSYPSISLIELRLNIHSLFYSLTFK